MINGRMTEARRKDTEVLKSLGPFQARKHKQVMCLKFV
jgi:hypothetical protein